MYFITYVYIYTYIFYKGFVSYEKDNIYYMLI